MFPVTRGLTLIINSRLSGGTPTVMCARGFTFYSSLLKSACASQTVNNRRAVSRRISIIKSCRCASRTDWHPADTSVPWLRYSRVSLGEDTYARLVTWSIYAGERSIRFSVKCVSYLAAMSSNWQLWLLHDGLISQHWRKYFIEINISFERDIALEKQIIWKV